MSKRILLVGGCPAPYHRLEPALPPLQTALEGHSVTVSGILHPDGGDAFVGDYSALTAENLEKYDAVVLYTTGNNRFGADVSALISFVEGGKALIGIHCAADSFTDDPAFVSFIGAKFRTHPAQLDIATSIVDDASPITNGLGGFTVHDELYLFADYDPANVNLLAETRTLDDNGPIPISWTREPGSGRLFYISLGHNPTTLADPNWQKFFKNGAAWALREAV